MQPTELSQAEGNLKILKIVHYVYAGLSLLGIAFLFLHYFMMTTILKSMPPEGTPSADGNPAPAMPDFEEVMGIFVWVYALGGIVILAIAGLNLLSAMFMGKRQNRIFSIIISGINCLNIPLGTILGIFSLVFLMKPVAQHIYSEVDPSKLP